MTDIQKRLFELQDHAYGDFHSGLIPELPREYFIGVRVPVLKKFVKEYKKEAESETFLKQLPVTAFANILLATAKGSWQTGFIYYLLKLPTPKQGFAP